MARPLLFFAATVLSIGLISIPANTQQTPQSIRFVPLSAILKIS